MGGLLQRMPRTGWTFIIGGLALSGFPLVTAGFWSKDEIFAAAWYGQNVYVFGALAISAFLTAFYTARQIFLTFFGSNPIGYNHPKHFPGSTFDPQTPVLPGAVLNGLGGDHNDYTMIGDGDWQISEYWTPMASYTMWLMAELSIVK